MKNRTAKTTTVNPNTQGNNKKVIAGSPRPVSKMEKVNVSPKMMSEMVKSAREGAILGGMPGPSLQAMQQQIEMDRLNSIPFKNNAIELFDRQRYGISREFDGQEMDGMLMERPTVGGGRVEVERFDMPGGGSSMSRTRYNNQGQPVRRVTKDKKIN
jgi:hypothetical protein